MTFFAVVRVDDACDFKVDKVDLNLWVLPGVLGQQVLVCDIGVRATLETDATQTSPLRFEMATPFVASGGPEDLIPRIRDDAKVCNLIFGDTGSSPRIAGQAWVYDDGDGEVLLQELNRPQCTLRTTAAAPRAFSVWIITTAGGNISSGSSVYVRFRFRLRRPGQLWTWQGASRRRSHAISDIRVNELRAQPQMTNSPDFSTRTKDVGRVNAFVIVPARLKAGRVSPEPKYVRILEGEVWGPYLGRRLSRRSEPFVITYWPKPGGVTSKSSFRGFIELERRRPTAGRAGLLVVAFLAAFMTLLQSTNELSHSVLARSAIALWVLVAGTLTISSLVLAWRVVQPLLVNGRWRKVTQLVRKWEARRYKL